MREKQLKTLLNNVFSCISIRNFNIQIPRPDVEAYSYRYFEARFLNRLNLCRNLEDKRVSRDNV